MGKVTLISKMAATIHVEERTEFDLFLDYLIIAVGELSALGIGTFFTAVATFDLLLWAGGRMILMTLSLIHFLQMIDRAERWAGTEYLLCIVHFDFPLENQPNRTPAVNSPCKIPRNEC